MIPAETLARLEFDKVRGEIERHVHSPATAELVRSIRPLAEPGTIRETSGRISEIGALDRLGIAVALGAFDDIRPALDVLRPAGAILAPQELLLFIPVLRLFAALSRQWAPREDIPLLKGVTPALRSFPDLLEPLVASIDSDGSIMDSASPLLRETRRAKRSLAGRIRKKIEEIIRATGIEKFLQDDFITVRSGRWVIPVRMDSKGMVKGVVHDVSSSGETAFMEPLEIIPFVNELENLTAEEKAEEIRILRQLSGWLREDAEPLAGCFATLLEIDRLNAMACFARDYGLEPAVLNEHGELKLVDARHPLLLMMHKRGQLATVEPLSLHMGTTNGADAKVLVITGPNAGGKTIALKTAGMLLLMALSGLPVPAGARSTFPLLDSLLVDIGDDQSIEQNHSTFSAHAARITTILKQSGPRSMVLLDELGAGTEPQQGAAIACGVLHELQRQGSMVIATTHLSDIIGFVHQAPGMVNAGMAFDDTTFSPLYRLVVGEPGQSHALEIARRFGMPEPVISFARTMLGNAGSEFSALLAELRQRRNELDAARQQQRQLESALRERERQLELQAAAIEKARREAAEKAWGDARELISATRRKMNSLLDELKRENRHEVVEKIRATEAELTAQLAPREEGAALTPVTSVAAGDIVHIRSLGCDGTVISSERGGKVRVRAGRMELEVALTDLAKPVAAVSAGKRSAPAAVWKTVVEESDQRELKLIGKRVDEALAELEPFVNHAAAAGLREVRIIHGVGSGRLRDAVREELGRHPLVESFRPGEAYEGRDGATVVVLRG